MPHQEEEIWWEGAQPPNGHDTPVAPTTGAKLTIVNCNEVTQLLHLFLLLLQPLLLSSHSSDPWPKQALRNYPIRFQPPFVKKRKSTFSPEKDIPARPKTTEISMIHFWMKHWDIWPLLVAGIYSFLLLLAVPDDQQIIGQRRLFPKKQLGETQETQQNVCPWLSLIILDLSQCRPCWNYTRKPVDHKATTVRHTHTHIDDSNPMCPAFFCSAPWDVFRSLKNGAQEKAKDGQIYKFYEI